MPARVSQPVNPLLQARLEEARRERLRREREAAKAEGLLTPSRWANKYRSIDGQPFTLERHKPLQQIYDDDHPYIVIMKCAQVGVSEMAVTRAMHALDVGADYWKTGKDGLNVAYLFPTIKSLADFSKERFAGLQRESEHITNMFRGGYDEIAFKQAGPSYLYLRGAWAGKSAGAGNASLKSFPADVLFLDEFDEMDPLAVAMAEKRLRASVVRRRCYISTPILPGRGIHAQYLLSDQHEWEIPCPSCGAWSTLDFFRDVRGDGQDFVVWSHWDRLRLRAAHWTVHCPSCKHEVDRFADGRWVARHPEVTDIRGYHVPALCFPMVKLAELAVNATSDDPSQVEEFFRSDLGLPYQRGGANVTDELIDKLDHELVGGRLPIPEPTWTNTTMGVDVGSRFHYRITSTGPDKARYVRAMGSVREWDDLSNLMRQYKVRQCVIDALPELHACQEWANSWPGKVVRALYPSASTMQSLLFRKNEEARTVHINRTMAMDKVYANLASGDERWPRTILDDPEVRAHLKSPVRITVKDDTGQPRITWNHVGPDHLYHACVYDTIAAELLPKAAPAIVTGRGARGW